MKEKQDLFVKEYLVDFNATQAAIRAGYSKNTAKEIGYENLTKPHIVKAINEAMKARVEALNMGTDFVLLNLKGILERSLQGKSYDQKTAVKVLELIGKHQNMFGNKDPTDKPFVLQIFTKPKDTPCWVEHDTSKPFALPIIHEGERV